MPRIVSLLLLSLLSLLPISAAPIQNGERIVLLGDALFETERHSADLEWELHRRFPETDFTLRNLAWSADTPAGISRASFDPAKAGLDRLREHLQLAQPSLVIVGYGMAASLQEITERSNDWALNPDSTRYGFMSAERFTREMESLLDLIHEISSSKARVILVSPIPHEDLRAQRPATPDPSGHNLLLQQYSAALKQLAATRKLDFIDSAPLTSTLTPPFTSNGIHLTPQAYASFTAGLCDALGWKSSTTTAAPAALRTAILKKSDAFFHRFRPANSTYLFGFRKREQGKNASEMAEWDSVIAAADAQILAIKHGTPPAPAPPTPAANTDTPALAKPSFTLPAGYQIDLWAEAPLVRKPLAIHWDGAGQLWVASTPIYPQIQPGKSPEDKIYVLADTNGDGKADSSSVFADDLLLPTGQAPVPTAPGEAAHACYVGASTELLLLTDSNSDGKSDSRRVVLSGFGTEDTHHNIHTLRWGPDHRLYLNQSIYTHSHLETPWGIIRLNSGGVLSYDPASERVEILSRGLWNPWGHVWNKDGQSFLSDGAGFSGLAWAFPGATFSPFEGSQRQMPTVSPGSYPKYAGLELIDSTTFPADWQGTAVTGDFRAHKIVRFAIEDLEKSSPPKSGYITRQLESLVVTDDVTFRPIDIKHGPDGALYVADWTNPIINHGEVDFRDPRRDHANGRIWRITRTDAPAIKRSPTPIPVARSTDPEKDAASASPRCRIEAMRTLARTPDAQSAARILEIAAACPAGDPYYEFAAWLSIRDVAPAWLAAIDSGTWSLPPDSASPRFAEAALALRAIPTPLATEAFTALTKKSAPPLDGTGPWIEWIGEFGAVTDVQNLFAQLPALTNPAVRARAMRALLAAAKRGVQASGTDRLQADFFTPATPESLALVAAWKLDLTEFLATQLKGSDELRNAAFDALASLRTKNALAALTDLLKSPDLKLRRQSLTTLASFNPELALNALPAIATDAGSDPDFWRPLFARDPFLKLFTQKIPKDLTAETYRAALTAARERGRPGKALVTALGPLAEIKPTSPASNNTVASILEALKSPGDPARGELIYRRPELTCTLCHAIGGVGGQLGPDLTSIGASAPVDYLVESILHPERKVKEGYHAMIYKLKDGSAAVGIPASTTATQQIIRTITGEQALEKSAIQSQEMMSAGGSLMPGGLINTLSDRETRDLFTFLQQLGKPGPYDGSKGNIARLWTLHPVTDPALATNPKPTPGGTPLATLVDGRLTPDLLKPFLKQQAATFAQTRFVTTDEQAIQLDLEGIREAWVDGIALPVASEPGRKLQLKPGPHTLTIKLTATELPPHFRASSSEARFLTGVE